MPDALSGLILGIRGTLRENLFKLSQLAGRSGNLN
jgi:hypothetical protein